MWNTDTLKKARFPPSDKRVTLRTAGRLTALFTPTYCRPPFSVVTHVQFGYLKWYTMGSFAKRIDWGVFPLSLLSLWKVAYCSSDESWRSFVSRSLIPVQPASDNKVWLKYTETDYGFYKKLYESKSVSSYVFPRFFS